MKPKLKLNHIVDLHDARYCAAVGVDMLGFQMQAGEPYCLAPKSVAEIMEWLSGPVGVGEFGNGSPGEIAEQMQAAGLQSACLPLDYPADHARDLNGNLIFRGPAEPLNASGLGRVRTLSGLFPLALFELTVDPADPAVWEALKNEGLMGRCILRFSEPGPIYSHLEREGHAPYAFSLGAFVEEPDGAIDYEACDDFIERYAELLPA